MTTVLWSNSTGPLGAGVGYTILSSSSSSLPLHHPTPSTLMDVVILNNNDSLSVPCFSCSGFASPIDYLDYFFQCLTNLISCAVALPTPFCAAKISEEVLHLVLIPANHSDVYIKHCVDILVHVNDIDRVTGVYNNTDIDREVPRVYYTDDDHMNGVINESFEEAGQKRKPAKIESIIDMVMARAELEALEGEKIESGWVPSDHNCAICIDDIEKPWESLIMPCSHAFHETCLVRWLDDNHVCPLCRFELPCDT